MPAKVTLNSAEAQEDAGQLISATVVYDVEVDGSGQTGPQLIAEALGHPQIPRVGDPFSPSEADRVFCCVGRKPAMAATTGGNRTVQVVCEYRRK